MLIPFPGSISATADAATPAAPAGSSLLNTAGQQRLLHLGLFSAGLAHQVRHTFTALIGLSEVLLEALPEEGQTEARREAMLLRQESLRGMRLIRLWLDYVHRPAQVKPEPVLVEEVIDDVATLWRLQRFPMAVRLEMAPSPSGLRVSAPGLALQQVLLNLLCNASQAMAEAGRGGVIRVEAWRREQTVVLHVADDGPGIPAERQARIFEPLVAAMVPPSADAPVDAPASAPERRPGLGLFLCRWLMRLMDGEIRLLESHPGETCFELQLPLLDSTSSRVLLPPRTRLQAGPVPVRLGLRRKPMKVLVIEDEPAVVEFLRAAFRRQGDHVHAVSSLNQARRVLLRSHWDLILLDWKLGSECASALLHWMERQRPELVAHVLLLSGDPSSGLQDAARRRGLMWMEKPFTLDELWDAVRKFFAITEENSSRAA